MRNNEKKIKQKHDRALVVLNEILYKFDGKYYLEKEPGIFYNKYIEVFGKIRMPAKINYVQEPAQIEKMFLLDISEIEVVELPSFHGWGQLFKSFLKLVRIFSKLMRDCDCAILRMLQVESVMAYLFSGIKRKPYAVEVVNDPKTLFSNKIVNKMAVFFTKRIVKRADGSLYITQYVLQEKYPCGRKNNNFSVSCCSVEFEDNEYCAPKKYMGFDKEIHLVCTIQRINQVTFYSKGIRTLVDIIGILKHNAIEAQLHLIGDADADIQKKIKEYGEEKAVESQIHFEGYITTRAAMFEKLRCYDLFVFPSQSEGLGRANIEAQAAGMPCLASNVGGIVELFPKDYLFDSEDAEGFANMIIKLMKQPECLNEMSVRNIQFAKQFQKGIIVKRRREFYCKLRDIS